MGILLTRDAAAEYIGIDVKTFDKVFRNDQDFKRIKSEIIANVLLKILSMNLLILKKKSQANLSPGWLSANLITSKVIDLFYKKGRF